MSTQNPTGDEVPRLTDGGTVLVPPATAGEAERHVRPGDPDYAYARFAAEEELPWGHPALGETPGSGPTPPGAIPSPPFDDEQEVR